MVRKPGLRFDLLNPAGCILGTPLGRGKTAYIPEATPEAREQGKVVTSTSCFLLKAPGAATKGQQEVWHLGSSQLPALTIWQQH